MRIEDDDGSTRTRDTIRQIQEYQARQAEIDAEQERPDPQAQARVDDANDPNRIDAQAEQAREDLARNSVQRSAQSRETQSSADRAEETAHACCSQQDRGQEWQVFAEREATTVPPSVEDRRNEEQRQQQTREEQQRINIGDLQNQMRIQSGKIGG